MAKGNRHSWYTCNGCGKKRKKSRCRNPMLKICNSCADGNPNCRWCGEPEIMHGADKSCQNDLITTFHSLNK